MPTTSLARRRVEPTWLNHPVYVTTSGPAVADLCARAGFAPDAAQEQILDLTFAIGPNGKSAAFEIDLIGPRQNFKTGVILQMELGWLFVTGERRIVHSAHELDTTEEAFNDLAKLIEDAPFLSRHLAPTKSNRPGISEGNGRWAISLISGQKVKYKARTANAGRGLSGDKVVLDEGFALIASHMGALLPTLTARPDPQVVVASSAGKLESAVLRDIRDRGRAGTSPRQAYVEYGDRRAWEGCADAKCAHAKTAAGCAADDEDRWVEIMPALGGRVQVETIRAQRQAVPPEEFIREFMVWWDDPDSEDEEPVAINTRRWGKLVNPKARKPDGEVVLSLDVNPKRTRYAIGLAGEGRKGRTLVMVKTGNGTAPVVQELKRLIRKNDDVAELVLTPGQAASLMPELIKAELGVEITLLTAAEAGQACASMQEAVKRKLLEHAGQQELDDAVAAARVRTVNEVQLFDRKNFEDEISPVVAVSAAQWRYSKVVADGAFNVW